MTESSFSLTINPSARTDPDLNARTRKSTATRAVRPRPARRCGILVRPGITADPAGAPASGRGDTMSKSSRKKHSRKKSSANHGNRPNA
ncbi:MAG: 50S ribosomal protein bL37 [Cellulomonas sp.]